jgi:hypothetical protein
MASKLENGVVCLWVLSHLTPSVTSLIFTGEFSPKREIKN